MQLNEWVRAAIAHKAMTIEELAHAVGRSKAAVGFWATGATKPSYAQITRIAEITGWPMPDMKPAAKSSELLAARAKRWPFGRIDQQKLLGLTGSDARHIENAILAAAADLNLDIRIDHSGKVKRA